MISAAHLNARPLSDKSLPGRLSLIEALEEFALIVVSVVEGPQIRMSSVSCLNILAKRLLAGKESEITPEVRRRLLNVVTQILAHASIALTDQPTVESLFDVIFEGVGYGERNVRLAAGYVGIMSQVQSHSLRHRSALVSLVLSNEAESCRWKSRIRFFVDLYDRSCMLEPTRRETLLSAVGKMGRWICACFLA